MTLFDFRGNPVQSSRLKQERAAGRISGGVRSPFDPEVSAGLDPEKLANLLTQARAGDHEAYLAMAAEMEQRDAHYYSTLQTRKLGIFGLRDQVQAASENAADEAIADDVRSFIDTPAFKLAILDILDSLGKGFSVNEIMWETSESQWMPVQFKWRNPRWFQWDRDTGETLRLWDGTQDGIALDPFKFVIHQPKIVSGIAMAGGLARIVCALHMFKGYAIKDWMTFAEVFGMPIRIGKYGPEATEEDIDSLERAVQDIGSDAAATIPISMSIEFERANTGGSGSEKFFETCANWMNKEISKAVLGQTMTSENGGSLAQASIHNEVRLDIRNADALQFVQTVNQQILKPFVDLNHGPQKSYPTYELETDEPEDLVALGTALMPLVDRGLPVTVKSMLDRFGLDEPGEGEALLTALTPGGSGSADGPGDDDTPKNKGAQAKLVALKQWLRAEVKSNTNMRHFKTQLEERLAS